jgi:hypothetical protein
MTACETEKYFLGFTAATFREQDLRWCRPGLGCPVQQIVGVLGREPMTIADRLLVGIFLWRHTKQRHLSQRAIEAPFWLPSGTRIAGESADCCRIEGVYLRCAQRLEVLEAEKPVGFSQTFLHVFCGYGRGLQL